MTSRGHGVGMERSVAAKSPRGWPFGARGPFRRHVSAATSESPARVNEALLVESLWEKSRRYKSEPVPLRELQSQDPVWAQLYGEATSSRDDIYVDMRITKSMLKSHIRQKNARNDPGVSDEELLARLVDETPCPAPKYALPAANADDELDGPPQEPEETSHPLQQQSEPENHHDASGSSFSSHDAIAAALRAADVALRQVGEVPCEPTNAGHLPHGAAAQRLNHYGAVPLQSVGTEPSTKMSPMVSIMGRCEHDPNIWDTEGARTALYPPPGGQHPKDSVPMPHRENGIRANGGYPEPGQDHAQRNARPTEKHGPGGKGHDTARGYGNDGGDDGHDDDDDDDDDDDSKGNGAINGRGLAPTVHIPPAPRSAPVDASFGSDDGNDVHHRSPSSSPRSGPSSGARQQVQDPGSRQQPADGPRPRRVDPEHTTWEVFPSSPSHDGSGGGDRTISRASSPRERASASPDRLRDGSFLPSGGDSPSSPRSRSPTDSRYPSRRHREPPQAHQGQTSVDHPHRRESSPDRDYRSGGEPSPARARSPRSPPDGASSVRRPGRQPIGSGHSDGSAPQAAAAGEEVRDAPADRGNDRHTPRTRGYPRRAPKDDLDSSGDAPERPRSVSSPGRQGRGAGHGGQQGAEQPADGPTGSAGHDHPDFAPGHGRRRPALRDAAEPGASSSLPTLAEVAPDVAQPSSGQRGPRATSGSPIRTRPDGRSQSVLPRLAEVAPEVIESPTRTPRADCSEGGTDRGGLSAEDTRPAARRRPGRHFPVTDPDSVHQGSNTAAPTGSGSSPTRARTLPGMHGDTDPVRDSELGHMEPGPLDETEASGRTGHGPVKPRGDPIQNSPETSHRAEHPMAPQHEVAEEAMFGTPEPLSGGPLRSLSDPMGTRERIPMRGSREGPVEAGDDPDDIFHPSGSPIGRSGGVDRGIPSFAADVPSDFEQYLHGVESMLDHMQDPNAQPRAGNLAPSAAHGNHPLNPLASIADDELVDYSYPFPRGSPDGRSLLEITPQFGPAEQRDPTLPDDRLGSGYPANQDPNFRPRYASQPDGGLMPHDESGGSPSRAPMASPSNAPMASPSHAPMEHGSPESLPGAYPATQDPNFRPRMKPKQPHTEEDTAPSAALFGERAAPEPATPTIVPGDPAKPSSDPEQPRPSSKYKVTPYTRSDDRQPSAAPGLTQDPSEESKPKLSGPDGGFVQGSPDGPQAPYGGETEGTPASMTPGHASDALEEPSDAVQQQNLPLLSTSESELTLNRPSVIGNDDDGSGSLPSSAGPAHPSSRYQVTPYEPSEEHHPDQSSAQPGTDRPSSKYKVTPYTPELLPSGEPSNPEQQQSHHQAGSIVPGHGNHQSPRHGTWKNALADTRHNLGQPRFRVPVSPRQSVSSPQWNGPYAAPDSPLTRVVLAPATIPGDMLSPRLPVDENPLFDLHNGSTDAGSGRSLDGLGSFPIPGSGIDSRGPAHHVPGHAQHHRAHPGPGVPEAGGTSPGSPGSSNGKEGKPRRKKGVPVGRVAARIRRERKTPWRRTSNNDSEDESSAHDEETGSRSPDESPAGGRRAPAAAPDAERSPEQPGHPHHMADDVVSLDAWSSQQEPMNGRSRGYPSTLQAVAEDSSGQAERGAPLVSPRPPLQRQSYASQGSATADEDEPWLPGQEERMDNRPANRQIGSPHGGRPLDGSSGHQGSPSEGSAAEAVRGTGAPHGPSSWPSEGERPAESSRSGSSGPVGLRLENNPLVPRRPGRDGSLMDSGNAPRGPWSSPGAHPYGEEADNSSIPPGASSMGPRMPSHEVPVYRDPQVGSSASTASYEDILGSVDGDFGDPEAAGGLARSTSEPRRRFPSPSPEQHGNLGVGGPSGNEQDPHAARGRPRGNTDAHTGGGGQQQRLRSPSPSRRASPSRPVPGDVYEGHHSPPQDYQQLQPPPGRGISSPRQAHSQPDHQAGRRQPPYQQTPQQSRETDEIRRQRGRDRDRRPRRHSASPEVSSDWETSDGGYSPPERQPQSSSRRLTDERSDPGAPHGRPYPHQAPVSPSHPHSRASDGDAWSPSNQETPPGYRPMEPERQPHHDSAPTDPANEPYEDSISGGLDRHGRSPDRRPGSSRHATGDSPEFASPGRATNFSLSPGNHPEHMPRGPSHPGDSPQQQQRQLSSSGGGGSSPHMSMDSVWEQVRPRTPGVDAPPTLQQQQPPSLAGSRTRRPPGHQLSEGAHRAPAAPVASQGRRTSTPRRRSLSDSDDVSGDESPINADSSLPTERWGLEGRPFSSRAPGRTVAPPAAEGRPMPSTRVPQPPGGGDEPSSSDSDYSDPSARRRVSGSGSGMSDSDAPSGPNVPGWSEVPAGTGRLHDDDELEASEAETADSISDDVVPAREDRPTSESPNANIQPQRSGGFSASPAVGGNPRINPRINPSSSSGPRVNQSPVRPGSFLTDRGLRWSQSASPTSSSADSGISHDEDEDAAPEGRVRRASSSRQDASERNTERLPRGAFRPSRPVHNSSSDDEGPALGRRPAPRNRPAPSSSAAKTTPRVSPGTLGTTPGTLQVPHGTLHVANEAAAAANPHGRLQLMRVMRWPENEDGVGLALLKICFRAWRLLTWVRESDEDRNWATAMLSHQRLALALLYSSRMEPQPELADRLWPRRDAHRLLDSGLDKMRLVVKDLRKAAAADDQGVAHEDEGPRRRDDATTAPMRAQTSPEDADAGPARRPRQETPRPFQQLQQDSLGASSSEDERPVLARRGSRPPQSITRRHSPGQTPASRDAPQRDARRGGPTADEEEFFTPSGSRNSPPREMEQGGYYPDTWIELLEQVRAKMALRAKRHAFNIWAGQRRISRIVDEMHCQRGAEAPSPVAAGPIGGHDAAHQDCSRDRAMMEECERWASQMLQRTQKSKAARALRRWQAFASGEAAARRWQRIADEANARFTYHRSDESPSLMPMSAAPPPLADEAPPGVAAWDNDRLRALAGIFSGMGDSDVSSLLDGLDPNERQVIEYQLNLLRDHQARDDARRRPTPAPPAAPPPPATNQAAAEPVSFCRRFPA